MLEISKITFSLVFLVLIPNAAVAQIIPDTSLGSENSVVDSNGDRDTLRGGAIRDANLFHSFQEFNVEALREAYFANPDGIDNIFSRVTGNSFSNIQGVLGVLGNANLYLINPNGILFGENARLDVNGSFFASTADSLVFENGFEFSAANPDAPPLLTISIPIGLRFRDNPQPIINVSVADDVGLQVDTGETLGLIGGNVLLGFPGLPLSGKITAPGGNVELGGLLATGTVTLDDNLKFSFPAGVDRADVSFFNASQINVASDGGGSITINAGDILLSGGSKLLGGIAEGLGNLNSQAGDITLNATGSVSLDNESNIQNPVNRNAVGNSGDINVNADSLTLESGSFFSTSNFGLGNGGDININVAEAVVLDGVSKNQITRFASVVSRGARGNAGDININAGSLALNNGAWLNSRVSFSQAGIPGGIGNGGDININVKEAVTISGFSQEDNIFSQIISRLGTGAEGSAGDINIKARTLTLEDGGFLSSSTFGQGAAGDINLDIEEALTLNNSGRIFSTVDTNAITPLGELSTITIQAGSLSITNTASLIDNEITRIDTSTEGTGNAGNVVINVDGAIDIVDGEIRTFANKGAEGNAGNISITGQLLSLKDEALLRSITLGQGNAGNITIDVDESISLANDSFISSDVLSNAVGQGGQINLTAKSVSLSGTSFISTSTFSGNEQSNGGNIVIDVDESLNLTGGSFLISSTEGENNGGNIEINAAKSVNLIEGSFLTSSTIGKGNAGNIEINATDSILVTEGSQLQAFTASEGNAGNIVIDAESADIFLNNAFISTSVLLGSGQGGDIRITGRTLSLDDGSSLLTTTAGQATVKKLANSGNIQIDVSDSIILSTGSSIDSNTEGQGNAGNVTINAGGTVSFNDTNSGINTAVRPLLTGLNPEFTQERQGGNIDITARSLSVKNGALLSSSTLGQGDSGIISISTDEAVTLSGAGTFILNTVERGGVGNSQGISIQAESLSITEGAQIQTLVRGASENNPAGIGNAGNININVRDKVSLSGIGVNNAEKTLSSLISSELGTGAKGRAGNINITARSLSLDNGARLSTSSGGQGDAGNITFDIQDTINLSRFAFNSDETIIFSTSVRSVLEAGATGTAGDINLKARSLSLNNGARLINSSFGKGNAGNITFDIQDTVNLSGFSVNSNKTGILSSQITSTLGTEAEGKAGNIDITARSLSLENGASLNTGSFGRGTAGNIILDIQDTVSLSGFAVNSDGTSIFSSQISSELGTGGEGKAGDINIKAQSLSLENGASLNTSSSGRGDAGNITLDIQDSVNLSGFTFNNDGTSTFPIPSVINETSILPIPSVISSLLGMGAKGKAGNINITARSLSLEDGAGLSNSSFGEGNAGNITINIDDSVNLFGSSVITNSVEQEGVGNGGNLDIQAQSLTIKDGSQINTVVFRAGFNTPGGKGQGGNIQITTTDFVDISGVGSVQFNIPDPFNDSSNITGLFPTTGFSSGILAATQRGASGDAGSIFVTTNVFRIADGAVVDNSTTNNSNAGNITINANTFESTGGGQIITATRGSGNAANIKLNIVDRIFISGSDPNFAARLARANEFGSIQGGDNIVTNQGAASGVFANTSADSTGDGGNIEIGIFKPEGNDLILDTNRFTQEITLANGARIAADSQGQGNGGAIFIQAEDLTLDDRAEILAETTARQDDNTALSEINLGVADLLQLKNDSRISTQALSNADGGQY